MLYISGVFEVLLVFLGDTGAAEILMSILLHNAFGSLDFLMLGLGRLFPERVVVVYFVAGVAGVAHGS